MANRKREQDAWQQVTKLVAGVTSCLAGDGPCLALLHVQQSQLCASTQQDISCAYLLQAMAWLHSTSSQATPQQQAAQLRFA
jgi:hypothetical protein